MFTRFAALARTIRQSQDGAVAIFMGLILVVLLGMTGMAAEIGLVLYKRQQQQLAADAAAFSGAVAYSVAANSANAIAEAKAIAASAGYVNGVNGVVVTVNNPPVSGSQNGKLNAVQVIIAQPQTLAIANLVTSLYGSGPANWTVAAGAVATAGGGGGPTPCMRQLNSAANPGVTISNGVTVKLGQCGLTVCSTGNQALTISGGANLNLTSDSSGVLPKISVAGKLSVSNGAKISTLTTNDNKTNQYTSNTTCPTSLCTTSACTASADPYANNAKVKMPPIFPTACDQPPAGTPAKTYCTAGGWQCTSNMVPGHYCSTPNLAYGSVTMSPGVYYMDGGKGANFNVNNGVSLTCPACTNGAGVTIVLTSSTGSNYATVSIGNGASVKLAAPSTSGAWNTGILFYNDPVVSNQNIGTENFQGGASLDLTGALYFPNQTVNYSNGVSSGGCTNLIAGTISFQGGADLEGANCKALNVGGGAGGATALVE